MSNRAVIARYNDETNYAYQGRYHHWDGYPTGLGRALFKLFNASYFNMDLDKMCRFLIDNHPAGWSNIIDCDFTKEPGFIEHRSNIDKSEQDRPECYCHGDRHEEGFMYTESIPNVHIEYYYIFHRFEDKMDIINSEKFIATVDLMDYINNSKDSYWKELE